MRALVVEDDPRIAADLARALQSAGFRVERAADGEQAWFQGGTEGYDLIVLDLGLPHPQVQIERFTQDGAAWWRATCLLKLSLLESLYERSCDFPAGHRMRGNFYKCGDLTDAPHWGSWAPVERVDFHVPHLFGEIIVTAAGK